MAAQIRFRSPCKAHTDQAARGHSLSRTLPSWLRAFLALDRHCDSVPTAKAKSRDTAMNVATNHLVDQSDEDPGSAGADGMTDGDSSAVDVHSVQIESEFADYAQSLN